MTLYEITQELEEALASFKIDEETGEVLMDFEKIEALNLAKDKKIENIGLYILNLRAEFNALLERKKSIENRAKSLSSKIDGLTNYLTNNLNGEPFKCVDFEIKYRKSERVELTEAFFENSYNEKFCRVKTEPNKAEIKQAIKDGYFIQGAKIVPCLNMVLK